MTAPLILASNTISGEYEVANSLRFNDDSSDTLTLSEVDPTGNRKTVTLSVWIKRCKLGTEQAIYSHYFNTNYYNHLRFGTGDQIEYYDILNGTYNISLETNRKFRDTSAWYHIVVRVDTTQSTEADRVRLYINGVQETSFATMNYPSQDATLNLDGGAGYTNFIGQRGGNVMYFDGYMAEFFKIQGTSYAPTEFGEFDSDTGIWKPKQADVTFGSKGVFLDFEDSSALGNDVSGNDNDFTVNNLTSIDQTTDTCTNNFCTWNSIADNLDVTLSEGNTKVAFGSASTRRPVISNFGVSKGKWYWEWEAEGSPTGANIEIGIVNYASPSTQGNYLGQSLQGDADFTTYIGNGVINMSGTSTTGLSTYTGGDIIGVAVDMDNTLIYFYKNGTLVNSGGTNFSGMEDGSGFIFMANADRSGASTYTASVNFGNPNSAPSSSQSDGNGYGNFEYAPPSGYYALCTKNLAEYG